MKLYNGIVLACTLYISSTATFVKCENKTSNQSDPEFLNYHELNDLQNVFVKKFNLILRDKNKELESLQEKITEKDKIIQSYNSDASENEFLPQQNTKTLKSLNLQSNSSKCMDFVKKRLRIAFQKELNDIIEEKDFQIYLLKQLIFEKDKTIEYQMQLKRKKFDKMARAETVPKIFGIGEPSLEK